MATEASSSSARRDNSVTPSATNNNDFQPTQSPYKHPVVSEKTERELRESVELFTRSQAQQSSNGRQQGNSDRSETTTNGSSVFNANGSVQPARQRDEDVDVKPARDSAEPGESKQHIGKS